MLVYFQMESTLPDGVPVPLHELSARQINQLDPFRSVLECIDSSRAGKSFHHLYTRRKIQKNLTRRKI